MRRTPLKRFTPLRSHTRLKVKTPLKRTTGLKPQSEKAKAEAWVWSKVKQERAKLLIAKFGYLPCEFCKKPIGLGQIADAHHANRRRNGVNNNLGNCRILHRLCHSTVTDGNIDVPSLL